VASTKAAMRGGRLIGPLVEEPGFGMRKDRHHEFTPPQEGASSSDRRIIV
jgi:hypothetical protein